MNPDSIFSDLLAEFSTESIDFGRFVLNALIAALLSWILSIFYERYGVSISNRSKFSKNFVLLALSTMLIIYIVKSSVALSLGLVGALSIVRFRAAIKEPEELTYLFLVIGIGLGMGANQPVITVLAFLLILSIQYLRVRSGTSNKLNSMNNQMVLHVNTDMLSESQVNTVVGDQFRDAELKRFTKDKKGTFLSYIVDAKKFEQISQVKNKLEDLDANVEITFVDNKNLNS